MLIFIYFSSILCTYVSPFLLLLSLHLTNSYPPLTVVSKKFRPNINVVRVQELNFVLRSEIFVHYDGQLKAYHLILGYVPSYTSYQDLSSVLTVGNPLLLYLDVRLPGFLPQGLTSREAKHLGPRLVRHEFP